MHDQMLQPLLLDNKNKHVGFGNKQQVLHEFILLCIVFLVNINIPKVICDDPITIKLHLFLDFAQCCSIATRVKLTLFHLHQMTRCLDKICVFIEWSHVLGCT
jgi:hypothetical protein